MWAGRLLGLVESAVELGRGLNQNLQLGRGEILGLADVSHHRDNLDGGGSLRGEDLLGQVMRRFGGGLSHDAHFRCECAEVRGEVRRVGCGKTCTRY